ncbi:putative 2-hydroxy-6-oxo-6-phenylhexa-2,4-dienoate hydrolase [Carnobacterium maltaromaticum]|uniref:alpha/beta fold hydrolase n=1 Tax=Carnobacterium maltaromaticum TaxID=2751 RepID=UPI000704D818|nr:alpha/beta hydrolase [Carnobacterium maltaromaticum]KRN73141.1 alpha beta fold family hydrolase [Carnobacterium maltaromaticum]MBC9809272.1 alpha/beta fold hydrolase [Carnobacterium maltaromaticum]CRH17392.1 putative 2-hydroxy-6-oxo-6-phenylhexa-2,4-dienoate hydrolase [Carnobacterium maltaromaticum]
MENIYFSEYGNGIPIIFLHGWELDHTSLEKSFEPVFKKNYFLNSKFKRIYIDLPGMGKSFTPKLNVTNEEYVEILVRFIYENFSNEVILVGHSYGGYLNIAIQKKLSDKVIGIFLLAPVVQSNPSKRILPKKINCNENNYHNDSPHFPGYISNNYYISKKGWKLYLTQVVPGLMLSNQKFTQNFEKKSYASLNENFFTVHGNEIDIAVVVGRNDTVVGYEDTLPMIKVYPNLTYCLLDSCGHNIQIDQLEVVHSLFERFILKITLGQNSL